MKRVCYRAADRDQLFRTELESQQRDDNLRMAIRPISTRVRRP